jgi:hypothetical protein
MGSPPLYQTTVEKIYTLSLNTLLTAAAVLLHEGVKGGEQSDMRS